MQIIQKMANLESVYELFSDKEIIEKIKKKLPKLFRIAELESSRAGKIGMEVGSVREKVIIGLLIHRYGEKAVDTDITITTSEVDVKVNGHAFSIKTITGINSRIKVSWTVDAQSSKHFVEKYKPKCDILLAQISWGTNKGGFFLIPLAVQRKVLDMLGNLKYLKLPKEGTNPRGIEFTKEAINLMLSDKETQKITIDWTIQKFDFSLYKRWVDYWMQE